MTNPCFGFGQIHTNNATLVRVTSRCGAGDHIGFTPPLPHRSSPTCICIQPTIQQFSFFILTIWLWMTKNFQQPVWYPQRNEEKAKVFETQLLYTCCDWERGECFWNAQFFVLFATKREEKVFYKYLWDNVCKEMRGESFWNTQFWCYFQ